ncbi:MAG TPA: exo-beta-N-acetylmuramidase NamZ domain-containing protein, partial [Polyangia bacterium]
MAVVPGIEVLINERRDVCRGRKVGVLCHPASITPDLTHVVDRLIAAGIKPVHLFGPEHGVRGEAQDMVGVSGEIDRRTGSPVTSLYGNTFESLSPP